MTLWKRYQLEGVLRLSKLKHFLCIFLGIENFSQKMIFRVVPPLLKLTSEIRSKNAAHFTSLSLARAYSAVFVQSKDVKRIMQATDVIRITQY